METRVFLQYFVCACSIRVCEIGEYLENYTYVKSITDDSVITYDESVGTPDTVSIDHFKQNVK